MRTKKRDRNKVTDPSSALAVGTRIPHTVEWRDPKRFQRSGQDSRQMRAMIRALPETRIANAQIKQLERLMRWVARYFPEALI